MIEVRITAFDTASETDNSSQADEFNLVIDNTCLDDEISIVQGIDDYVYYLNEDTTSPDFDNKGPVLAQDKVWNPEWA